MEDVFDGIVKSVYWLFWEIIKAIGYLLNSITDLFEIFTGLENIEGQQQDILTSLFSDNFISTAYTYLTIVAFVLMLLFTVIAVLKQDYFDKDGPRSKAPIIKNVALGFFLYLIIAPATMVILNVLSLVTEYISLALTSGEDVTNIAKMLFDSSFSSDIYTIFSIDPTVLEPWNEIDFDALYNEVEVLKTINFRWYIYMMGGLFIAWNLLGMLIDLVKRIFTVLVLYLIAPFEIANMVSDDGIRFKKWKDNAISQLVSILGIVVAFLVFKIVVSSMEQFVDELGSLFIVIIMMGGSLVVKDTARMLAEFSGANKIFAASSINNYVTSNNISNNKTNVTGNSLPNGKSPYEAPKIFSETKKNVTIGSGKKSTRSIGVSAAAANNASPGFVSPNRGSQSESNYSRGIDDKGSQSRFNNNNSTELLKNKISSQSSKYRSLSLENDGLSKGFSPAPVLKMVYSENNIGDSKSRVSSNVLDTQDSSISDISKQYAETSRNFENNLVMSPNKEKFRETVVQFVGVANNENKAIQKEVKNQDSKMNSVKKNLNPEQKTQYKNIQTLQNKAQTDFRKTTEKMSSMAASGSNVNAADLIRMKEKADKQRERLVAATNQASSFYKKHKKGE